jgi:hypothetical protein
MAATTEISLQDRVAVESKPDLMRYAKRVSSFVLPIERDGPDRIARSQAELLFDGRFQP